MAGYSLFVQKMLLNSNQPTNQPSFVLGLWPPNFAVENSKPDSVEHLRCYWQVRGG